MIEGTVGEILGSDPTALDAEKIYRGDRLGPGEALIWQGGPDGWTLMRRAFHLPLIAGYFLVLQLLNAWQAYAQAMPLEKAIRASLPLLLVSVVAFGIFAAVGWFSARTTRYVITDRRFILKYGIAMPATLSIPFSKVARLSVAIHENHAGDIPLKLKDGNHIGYLKLWPHARPWHLKHPEPTLRAVPQAGLVASLATRAIGVAMNETMVGAPAAAKEPDHISSLTCA